VANRDANIDLLFRNGLKDYEVLPPVEVWNNIYPVIRKKQRPVLLLRSAALVAVLLSISFLTYRWAHEISTSVQNPTLAVRDESFQSRDNTGNTEINRILLNKNQQKGVAQSNQMADISDIDALSGYTDPEPGILNPVAETRNLTPDGSLLFPGGIQTIRNFKPITDNSINPDFEELDGISFENPIDRTNRWSVSAMASPTYYLRSETGNDELSKQFHASEQSRITYSGGVAFTYKISNKLSVQSGLYYSSLGREVDGITSFAGFKSYDYTKGDHNFEVLTSNGLIYTENSDVFLRDNSGDRVLTRFTNDVFDPNKAHLSYINSSLYQNFSYLEMPVILRYKLIDKSIDFNLIGGLSYNLLVNNSVNTIIDGNKYNVGKTAGLNQFMVSSSVGMGLEYNLSKKFSLNLEPTFRYYLNPFGETYGLKIHPYSFGVFSGLSYRF
jgi:hypothetical protein